MNGKQLQKNISAQSLSGSVPLAIEYLILFGLGIIAILLHARLRTPLNIPGHHGIEFMALIMAGRVASNIKWAASVSTLGIGFILLFPVFGFSDPLMGLNYMIPGVVLDFFYHLVKGHKNQLFMLTLISALAYSTIPLSRFVISAISGYPYPSFVKHGFFAVFTGHFIFGLAGGLAGAGITKGILKKIKRK